MRIPVELLLTISKHLASVRDLVKLRLVCKEWRLFVDEFCLDELVLFVGVYPTLDLWKTNSQPIDFKRLICSPSDNCPLDHEGFRYTFRNVKRLFLSIRSEREVSYQLDFDKLEKLEITRYYSLHGYARLDTSQESYKLKSEVSFQLNLPNLTAFHINELDENIVLNCPKLALFSFDLIEEYSSFDCPLHYEQIKQLNCLKGYKFFDSHQWIKKLKNLEIIYYYNFYDPLDLQFLAYFPKLRLLYFNACAQSNILAIEEEKKQLNRTDLVTYYYGKKFDEITLTLSWGENLCYSEFTEFYKDDLAKLAPTLPHFDSLRYDEAFKFSDKFNKQFYKSFFKKLTDVQVLDLAKLSHTQEEIVELIDCFKNIVMLRVAEGGNLEQSFYDLLPDRYPYLRVLEVDNRRLEKLNLKFLFRFSELYTVKFSNPAFVQNKSDYRKLMQKIERKKDEIMRINGNHIFNIDEQLLKL